MSELALYIHWPFCLKKCPYCDFNSHVRETVDHTRFKGALLQELRWLRNKLGARSITSIFFGGGTPSLMQPATVEALINEADKIFRLDADCEITLEANPTSVEVGNFKALRAGGVNRVSLGVQSLVEDQLKFLGREHSAREALQALDLAATHFHRFSFDLIYALPNQTTRQWEAQLQHALQFARGHVSLYQLTVEENTAFFHDHHVKSAWALPPDEEAVAMYTLTQEITAAHNLPAYEVSNHAGAGHASRHNLTYWHYGEYAGIGPGAHGRLHTGQLVESTRAIKSPERWLESVESMGHGMEEIIPLHTQTQMEEMLMMRLRLLERVPYTLYAKSTKLELLEAHGLARLHADGFDVTPAGRLVLSSLSASLL